MSKRDKGSKRQARLSTADFLLADENNEAEFDDFEKIQRSNARSEACEDDYEHTAPYVDMLPEESYHDCGSPLRFPHY